MTAPVRCAMALTSTALSGLPYPERCLILWRRLSAFFQILHKTDRETHLPVERPDRLSPIERFWAVPEQRLRLKSQPTHRPPYLNLAMAGSPTQPPSPSRRNSDSVAHTDAGPVAAHPKLVSFHRDSEADSSRRKASIDTMSEQSPLLQPRKSEEEEEDDGLKVISPLSDSWNGGYNEESRSSWYLLLLTIGGLG